MASKKSIKIKAQDLLMEQIANIGYGSEYDEFVELCGGDRGLADSIMKKQMDRIAKLFGYPEAWFR